MSFQKLDYQGNTENRKKFLSVFWFELKSHQSITSAGLAIEDTGGPMLNLGRSDIRASAESRQQVFWKHTWLHI